MAPLPRPNLQRRRLLAGLPLLATALWLKPALADPQVRQVQAGDRLEIYRPLMADPKEVRRLRAAKAAEAKARNQ